MRGGRWIRHVVVVNRSKTVPACVCWSARTRPPTYTHLVSLTQTRLSPTLRAVPPPTADRVRGRPHERMWMCTQFMLFGFAFAYRMDQLCILSRIRSEAELAGQVICIKGSKLLRRNGGKCRKELRG